MHHPRLAFVYSLLTSLLALHRNVLAQQTGPPNPYNPASTASADDKEVFFQFVTRPDIGAPKWDIETFDADALTPGYWFVAPYAALFQTEYPLWNGAHIYDQRGELIWSGAPMFKHQNVHDFRVQSLEGVPTLTLNHPHDMTKGEAVILNDKYEIFKELDAVGHNYGPNMHDFQLINDGKTALMLTIENAVPTDVDLDYFKGTCNVRFQGFKEIDVATNQITYEWNDKGHITPDESNFVPANTKDFAEGCAKDWDITHFNSVDKFVNGDYLVSARHTDTLYRISHVDGAILWRLGGRQSDFVFRDARAKFSRQHHARVREENATHTTFTVFDNAVGTGSIETASSPTSWGLHIIARTDVTPMTVDLVARFEHPHWKDDTGSLVSQSRGSVEILPNGNVFMAWVWQSLQSEHSADGRLLQRAYLKQRGTASYRNYKYEWVGTPSQPPDVHSVAIQMDPTKRSVSTVVHVSWNGATEVATWNLLHANFQGEFTELIASSPRQGFETRFEYEGFVKHVILVALDASGKEIGRSKVKQTDLPPEMRTMQIAASELQWVEKAKNQSLQWVPDAMEEGGGHFISAVSSRLSNFGYFAMGVVLCIAAMCIAIVLILRKRAVLKQRGLFWSWGKQPQKAYTAVGDEEIEQTEWMLNKEGSREDR